jgi:hypothetical protein
MPINMEDIENSQDSPELAEFKKKVIETTKSYSSRHGHVDAANQALRELGLLDPDSMPVQAMVTVSIPMNVPGLKADVLRDKTQEEINAMIRDQINGVISRNSDYVQFRGYVFDTEKIDFTVDDANLVR